MQRPIFMLVSGDARRLDALRHDLSRRCEGATVIQLVHEYLRAEHDREYPDRAARSGG